jgi:hypothetical protein
LRFHVSKYIFAACSHQYVLDRTRVFVDPLKGEGLYFSDILAVHLTLQGTLVHTANMPIG